MKIKIIVSLLVFLGSYTAWACVNDDIAWDRPPKPALPYPIPSGYDLEGYKPLFNQKLKELRKLPNPSVETLSNQVALLIYLAQYEEAKAILDEILPKEPPSYAVAANLGTLYELLGKNDSALIWIQKSVEINHYSHENSEWLHVNILKAKINPKKYLNTDSLIGTSFGNDTMPITNTEEHKLVQLQMQLHFQLTERVSFIKSKDEIVALLMFELANVSLLLRSTNSYLPHPHYSISQDKTERLIQTSIIYKKALEYGFKNTALLQKRQLKVAELLAIEYEKPYWENHKAALENQLKEAPKYNHYTEEDQQNFDAKNNYKYLMAFGLSALVVAAFAFVTYYERRKK